MPGRTRRCDARARRRRLVAPASIDRRSSSSDRAERERAVKRLAEDVGANPDERRIPGRDRRRGDAGGGPAARRAIIPMSQTPSAPTIDWASLHRVRVCADGSRGPAPIIARKTG